MFATILKSGDEFTHLSHNLTEAEATEECGDLRWEGFDAEMFKQSKGHECLDAGYCPDCVLDAERNGAR